jgi:ribose 5-phosphate isomerase A
MNGKEQAALEALKYVRDGMVVGLGSGSTSECFIRALGNALRAGTLKDLRGVATSVSSEQLAIQLGIPVISLRDCGVVDVAVDGADEVDPKLNLIKGLGGALVREKIIEQNARRFVCIVDDSKLSPKLGVRSLLPVEVLPFCHDCHTSFFHSLGGAPQLRIKSDGTPYVTDNGNFIYHLKFSEGISSPADTERKLLKRAGIVGTGLFLSMADVAVVGSATGVQVIRHH